MYDIPRIAHACHEVNRAITAFIKDVPMQPAWEDCGEDMRQSCIRGVEFALRNLPEGVKLKDAVFRAIAGAFR
jgi:hypothetical protein